MKAGREGFHPIRRDRLLQELVHDSYKSQHKLPEPTRCPGCGATYHKGRWTWDPAPAGAQEERCPACHRVDDEFPAGYVSLAGAYLAAHRDEIVRLVRAREAKENAEHPLERIMAIADADDGILVTTTDTHLARAIAEALHDAYKGELEYHYNKQENLLRARWSR